jgi:hypothetical protein
MLRDHPSFGQVPSLHLLMPQARVGRVGQVEFTALPVPYLPAGIPGVRQYGGLCPKRPRRPGAVRFRPGSAADGHGVPASFKARVIRAALCPASRWPNIHRTTGAVARSGSRRCARRPHAACALFGCGPASPSWYPYGGRPPRYRPCSRVCAAIAVLSGGLRAPRPCQRPALPVIGELRHDRALPCYTNRRHPWPGIPSRRLTRLAAHAASTSAPPSASDPVPGIPASTTDGPSPCGTPAARRARKLPPPWMVEREEISVGVPSPIVGIAARAAVDALTKLPAYTQWDATCQMRFNKNWRICQAISQQRQVKLPKGRQPGPVEPRPPSATAGQPAHPEPEKRPRPAPQATTSQTRKIEARHDRRSAGRSCSR